MTEGADATFYPHAGCLRLRLKLYNIRSFCGCFGKHFWDTVICNRDNAAAVTAFQSPKNGIHYITIWLRGDARDGCVTMPMKDTVDGVSPLVQVRRIQRTARDYIRRRRALAAAMATHPRLGERSGMLSDMPDDVLMMMMLMVV
jgi:hypothetical protein